MVQDNSLAALPEELGECVLLKWLWAGNNAIVEVPGRVKTWGVLAGLIDVDSQDVLL